MLLRFHTSPKWLVEGSEICGLAALHHFYLAFVNIDCYLGFGYYPLDAMSMLINLTFLCELVREN